MTWTSKTSWSSATTSTGRKIMSEGQRRTFKKKIKLQKNLTIIIVNK
jgi:hypothetical protein